MSQQSGFSHVILVALVALVLGAVGFVGWRVYDANQQPSTSSTQTAPAKQVATTPEVEAQQLEKQVDAVNVESDLDSSQLDSDLSDLY